MSEYIMRVESSADEELFTNIANMYAEVRSIGKEILRCGDCRHFKKGEEQPPIDWCDYFHDEVEPDGFCAWGEKVVSE